MVQDEGVDGLFVGVCLTVDSFEARRAAWVESSGGGVGRSRDQECH